MEGEERSQWSTPHVRRIVPVEKPTSDSNRAGLHDARGCRPAGTHTQTTHSTHKCTYTHLAPLTHTHRHTHTHLERHSGKPVAEVFQAALQVQFAHLSRDRAPTPTISTCAPAGVHEAPTACRCISPFAGKDTSTQGSARFSNRSPRSSACMSPARPSLSRARTRPHAARALGRTPRAHSLACTGSIATRTSGVDWNVIATSDGQLYTQQTRHAYT